MLEWLREFPLRDPRPHRSQRLAIESRSEYRLTIAEFTKIGKPMDSVLQVDPVLFQLFFFIVLTLSAVIHEYAHGWVADRLGDPTARLSGRLTLNPIPHIDPIGTILLPALLLLSNLNFFFAYAKPVPVNPHNLRNPKLGGGLVAFAGPAANFLVAIILGLIVRGVAPSPFSFALQSIVYANLLLGVFNLVPIPPLDGSKVLFAMLPDTFHPVQVFLETYGIVLLLALLLPFYGVLSGVIVPIIRTLFGAVTGVDVGPF